VGVTLPSFCQQFPEQKNKAIQLVEEEEGQGGSDVLMKAVDLFCSDPRNP